MRIDVIHDTVCPWCFIGKRRLERALARRPDVRPELHWRPFLLNPDMPPEGIDRTLYLERKFGGSARVSRMLTSLRDAGQTEGIAFNFEAMTRTPSSMDSHRLIAWAFRFGAADSLVDAIFRAYFLEGQDTGDRQVLATIATSVGLDGPAALAFLNSGDGRSDVFMENAQTHRLSINGVPSFIFDTRYGIAGAQDPDILVRLIDMSSEGHHSEPLSRGRVLTGGPV